VGAALVGVLFCACVFAFAFVTDGWNEWLAAGGGPFLMSGVLFVLASQARR
jgi:hypothetical protein